MRLLSGPPGDACTTPSAPLFLTAVILLSQLLPLATAAPVPVGGDSIASRMTVSRNSRNNPRRGELVEGRRESSFTTDRGSCSTVECFQQFTGHNGDRFTQRTRISHSRTGPSAQDDDDFSRGSGRRSGRTWTHRGSTVMEDPSEAGSRVSRGSRKSSRVTEVDDNDDGGRSRVPSSRLLMPPASDNGDRDSRVSSRASRASSRRTRDDDGDSDATIKAPSHASRKSTQSSRQDRDVESLSGRLSEANLSRHSKSKAPSSNADSGTARMSEVNPGSAISGADDSISSPSESERVRRAKSAARQRDWDKHNSKETEKDLRKAAMAKARRERERGG